MKDLLQRSIEIIKENQSPSGAYIASPNFENYQYSWFRDGAYIAYSMDLVGEHLSAERFHNWASEVIVSNDQVINNAIQFAKEKREAPTENYLHTRYSINGGAEDDDWPNYQLDGIGTWLWSLNEHNKLNGNSNPDNWERSAALAVRYLTSLWEYPCSDSWEEFHDKIHTYTLASIYAGIKAYSELSGKEQDNVLDQILSLIKNKTIRNDHFVKYIGSETVDANLISLAVPYRVIDMDHPAVIKTISLIEEDLLTGGGVHRYKEDSYFGGGEWVLLTAWLGWYWAEKGDADRARELLAWIENQSDENGYFPEQVPENLNKPEFYDVWYKRWGEIAKPLLWSHAKYIILRNKLENM